MVPVSHGDEEDADSYVAPAGTQCTYHGLYPDVYGPSHGLYRHQLLLIFNYAAQ